MWNFYFQGILIAIGLAIFLMIVVLKSTPFRILNRSYVLPSSLFLLWNIFYILYTISHEPVFQYLQRGTLFFLPVVILHFLFVFLRNKDPDDWRFIKAVYGLSGIFFLLFLDVEIYYDWPRYFIACYYLPLIYKGFQSLYDQHKASVSRLERYQIIYITLAICVWIIGALFEFIRLPGFSEYPLGSIGGVTFLSIAARFIIRFRLLDLSILVGKLLVYIFLILVLAVFYFLFSQSWPDTLKITVAVVLLLLVYEPIKQWVEDWSNKVMLRGSYQLTSKLTELNKTLVTIIESHRVYMTFLSSLAEAEKIAHVSLFMREGDEGDYYVVQSPYFPSVRLDKIEEDKPIIRYLDLMRAVLVRDELERELQISQSSDRKKLILAVYRTLTLLDAELCIPIFFQKKLRGFISLRSTETTSTFNQREIELLSLLADQIGIISENSRLYTLMKQKDRLAAIGQMSAGLAHEIRNPLGALKATAQHLELAQVDNATREFLQIIVEEVNRLNEVVLRFLSFAHPLKLAKTSVNLNELITKTVNFLKNQQTWENITFFLELHPEIPHLHLDENQIKQVLLNLMLNAQQAMEEGGTLTIKTSFDEHFSASRSSEMKSHQHPEELPKSELKANILKRKIASKGNIEVSLEDTGTGINPDDIDKIFNPFFTTKETGSGLGLSIAHRILEVHGADIEVLSPPEKGTKFTIRFPVVPYTKPRTVKSLP